MLFLLLSLGIYVRYWHLRFDEGLCGANRTYSKKQKKEQEQEISYIVMFGMTGVGKSHTGNHMLLADETPFPEDDQDTSKTNKAITVKNHGF
jgi:predicted GTPase